MALEGFRETRWSWEVIAYVHIMDRYAQTIGRHRWRWVACLHAWWWNVSTIDTHAWVVHRPTFHAERIA